MQTCAHFIGPDQPCARGVDLQALAGGGAFYMVLRLPCIPVTNRRGETVRDCAHHTDNEREPK